MSDQENDQYTSVNKGPRPHQCGFTACIHSDMMWKQWFSLYMVPKEELWSLSPSCFTKNNIACPLRTNMENRFSPWPWDDVFFPLVLCVIPFNMGLGMLLLIQSSSKTSGLIGSKAGYVDIMRIFGQYWSYFERFSWGQQSKNQRIHITSLCMRSQTRRHATACHSLTGEINNYLTQYVKNIPSQIVVQSNCIMREPKYVVLLLFSLIFKLIFSCFDSTTDENLCVWYWKCDPEY